MTCLPGGRIETHHARRRSPEVRPRGRQRQPRPPATTAGRPTRPPAIPPTGSRVTSPPPLLFQMTSSRTTQETGPVCGNEIKPALSVDRKPLGTFKRGPYPEPTPPVAPHDPLRSVGACRSAIGRPILFACRRALPSEMNPPLRSRLSFPATTPRPSFARRSNRSSGRRSRSSR